MKAGLSGQIYRQLLAGRGEEMVFLQASGHSLNRGVTGSVAVVPLVIVIVIVIVIAIVS